MKHYLSACLIIKDENSYLREWLVYHRLTNFDHFYILDNESRIPVEKTLAHEVRGGLVTVSPFPGQECQRMAYEWATAEFGKETEWMAFIDIDEFIVTAPSAGNIREILEGFREFCGLGLHWRVFGSSGLQARPEGLQMEAFTMRASKENDLGRYTKFIVRPHRVRAWTSPHLPSFHDDFRGVNENRSQINSHNHSHTSDKIWINHYILRSRMEWGAKIARGNIFNRKFARKIEWFDEVDPTLNVELDDTILRFAPDVRREVGLAAIENGRPYI